MKCERARGVDQFKKQGQQQTCSLSTRWDLVQQNLSVCQTTMQWQQLIFLDMQMPRSDLELAAVTEIGRHRAAGYGAAARDDASFTKLMKCPLRHGPLHVRRNPPQASCRKVPRRLHRRGRVAEAGGVQELLERGALRMEVRDTEQREARRLHLGCGTDCKGLKIKKKKTSFLHGLSGFSPVR